MCGIFGVVSAGASVLNDFNELGQLNTVRGNVHYGWMGMYSASITPRCSPYAWIAKRYLVPFNGVTALELPVILGHVRAPTGGHNDNIKEVHPYETKDLLLAHNGVILNPQIVPTWKRGMVDSQAIILGVQDYVDKGVLTLAGIRNTIEQLEGQQACWLVDKNTGNIYCWRIMATLYIKVEAARVMFSSAKPSPDWTLIPEGLIFRVTPHGFTMACSFSYYSPYKS